MSEVCIRRAETRWDYADRLRIRQQHGYSATNWMGIRRLFGVRKHGDELDPRDIGIVRKSCFWMEVILALPLILSIVLSMLPLFGTHGQEVLFHMHRCCALAFAWVGLIHIYLAMRAQLALDDD